MSNIVIPTITVNGQTILHTENKYCGENIEVNVAIPNPTLDGTAITDYVLAPYTFYKDNLTKLIGTMVNRGAISTDITTKAQEVTIQQGYHSGSGVVKISAAEQAKIIASNIKSGVTILGQNGNVTPAKEEQTKTVSPTTSSQDVLPDTNKVLSKVTVNAIPTETKSQQPSLESGNQTINATSGKFMTSFTITKDTTNHVASNIRSGKTLYGVEGSLQPAKDEETKTVTPDFSSGNVVVTPTSGKVMTQVTVNKDTTNHIAGNIKKDITLYGVTGTYEGSGSTPTMKGYTITDGGSGILLTAPNYYASTQVIIIGTLKYSSEDYDMEGNDWEAVFVINHLLDVLSFSVTVTKNNSYGLTSSYTGVGGSIITTSAQALSTEVLPNVNYGNAGFMNITSVSDITPLYSN